MDWWRGSRGAVKRRRRGQARILFETIRNPRTGEAYTNAEMVRMSAGDLTEEEAKGIKTGEISDPSITQVVALAKVFGVPPSYLLDGGSEPEVLDEEVLEALADKTAGAILRESAHLSEREKEIVLGIVRQFSSQSNSHEGRGAVAEEP